MNWWIPVAAFFGTIAVIYLWLIVLALWQSRHREDEPYRGPFD